MTNTLLLQLPRREFSEDHVAFIMKNVAAGVQFLCSHHVKDCDIKPANVLVSLEGDVKVSGNAKTLLTLFKIIITNNI